MRIEVVRSGGFAGMTRRQEIDTAALPPHEGERIETLARAAQHEKPHAEAPQPDAFDYAVTIDGRTYEIGTPRGAWRALLDAL